MQRRLILSAAAAASLAAPAHGQSGQSGQAVDPDALARAERGLQAAESAVAEAQRAAEAARKASESAAAMAEAARSEIARLRGGRSTPTRTAAAAPPPSPTRPEDETRIRLSPSCPQDADIRRPAYAGVARACEMQMLANGGTIAAACGKTAAATTFDSETHKLTFSQPFPLPDFGHSFISGN